MACVAKLSCEILLGTLNSEEYLKIFFLHGEFNMSIEWYESQIVYKLEVTMKENLKVYWED